MLTLNIDQNDYLSEAGSVAGVRVSVSAQNIMPFPEDDGLTVGPGYATFVGLKQVVYNLHNPLTPQ